MHYDNSASDEYNNGKVMNVITVPMMTVSVVAVMNITMATEVNVNTVSMLTVTLVAAMNVIAAKMMITVMMMTTRKGNSSVPSSRWRPKKMMGSRKIVSALTAL